jgi:plastocyanin
MRIGTIFAAAILLGLPFGALGDPSYSPVNEKGQVEVILKEHRFTPAEIHVPAGKRVQLHVTNQDATADEFDSTALQVEKVIGGGSEGIVRLRPLDPGRYKFMGEFHPDTAQGEVIAE